MGEPLFLFPSDTVKFKGKQYSVVGSYACLYPNTICAKSLWSRDFHTYTLIDIESKSSRNKLSWINREELSDVSRSEDMRESIATFWNEIYAYVLEKSAGNSKVNTNECIEHMGASDLISLSTNVFGVYHTHRLELVHGHIIGRTAQGDNGGLLPTTAIYNVAGFYHPIEIPYADIVVDDYQEYRRLLNGGKSDE